MELHIKRRLLARCRSIHTYAAAAHEGDDESLEPPGRADDPDQSNEQDHTEDVLNAREVNSKNGTELHTHIHDAQCMSSSSFSTMAEVAFRIRSVRLNLVPVSAPYGI